MANESETGQTESLAKAVGDVVLWIETNTK